MKALILGGLLGGLIGTGIAFAIIFLLGIHNSGHASLISFLGAASGTVVGLSWSWPS